MKTAFVSVLAFLCGLIMLYALGTLMMFSFGSIREYPPIAAYWGAQIVLLVFSVVGFKWTVKWLNKQKKP